MDDCPRKGGRAALDDFKTKRDAFCEQYVIDHNATQAAIRAGYSPRSAGTAGSRNLDDPKIQARIAQLEEAAAAAAHVDATWVLIRLKGVVESCMREDPIFEKDVDGTLIQTGTRKMDSAGANKALELLGKYIGMFSEKVQVSTPQGIRVQYDYGDHDDDDEGSV